MNSPTLRLGTWLSLGSPAMAELASLCGFDWVLIDTEHAPNEVTHVADTLRALAGSRVVPVVRPAWNDAVLFKRLLDVGAQTLLVPYVQSAEEARRAVSARSRNRGSAWHARARRLAARGGDGVVRSLLSRARARRARTTARRSSAAD